MFVIGRALADDGPDVRVLPHVLLHAQPAAAVPVAEAVVWDAEGDFFVAGEPAPVLPCHGGGFRHSGSRSTVRSTRDCVWHWTASGKTSEKKQGSVNHYVRIVLGERHGGGDATNLGRARGERRLQGTLLWPPCEEPLFLRSNSAILRSVFSRLVSPTFLCVLSAAQSV